MARGLPDFWQGTIASLPTIGEGQIAWYESDTALVDASGTDDLINYVVPDIMVLHVCSGVISCGLPRLQRYDLRQTPGGSWISPTSYIDPDGKWSLEERAFDGSVLTNASNLAANYNHYLELLLSTPRSCDTVRIYAADGEDIPPTLYNPDLDIDVYYSGAWHNIFSGEITKSAWVEKAIGSTEVVSKIRVKSNTSSRDLLLYEVEINTTGTTAQEGMYFDTHAVIPYLPQAPYVVEAGATFAVRVYNDDDDAQNMSVALAGFLQRRI